MLAQQRGRSAWYDLGTPKAYIVPRQPQPSYHRMLMRDNHIIGRSMRIIEEELAVSCHRRCARDPCLLQARQTLCQRQASTALRKGLGQRRLGWVAAGGCVGVCTAHALAVEGPAEGAAFCRCLRHDINPAVVRLVQPVKGVEAILSLICQPACWFALVPGEPLRAEEDAAIEQVGIDALHHARALPGEQGENRPQRSHSTGRKVGGCQLGRKHRWISRPALGALQAHESLRQGIDPWPVRIGTIPAEAGDMGLDERGLSLCNTSGPMPIRSVASGGGSPEDIRRGRDLLRHFLALWRPSIH